MKIFERYRRIFARRINTCMAFGFVLAALISIGFVEHFEKYPQNYFSAPVDRQVLLSATFGELRSNHFHAGIDIKSRDGSVGEPLTVAAPGYISRIAVLSGGYGNVIYVDHPNGYTSVYAHLHRFTDNIAEYVKSMQYAQQQFEVNLYPEAQRFPLEDGDIIGYLGNSGGSTGPHLHFEIRKSTSQIPVNPLLFGIQIRDNRTPLMRTLKVCNLDGNLSQIASRNYSLVALGNGKYIVRDTIEVAARQVGFGIKVDDQMDGVSNQFGIYSLSLNVDEIPQYEFALDEFAFSQTRFLNAHIDYEAKRNGQGYFHKCYKLPGNALDIYTEKNEKGIIALTDSSTRKVVITVLDFSGNTSELAFYIRGKHPVEPTEHSDSERISYPESKRIHISGMNAQFEPHTFYQNLNLLCFADTFHSVGIHAPVYHLGDESTPVHRYFDLSLQFTGIPDRHKSKAFIGQMNDRGRLVSWGGAANGNQIYSRIRSLGDFTIGIDTVAPEIIPITFRSDMRGMSRMRFRIQDNQNVTGQANDLKYEARVDGKWILMEFEGKRDMLTHWFDGRIEPGDHELVLKVSDDRGNETVLKRSFTR